MKAALDTKYTGNTELSDETRVREVKWERLKSRFMREPRTNNDKKAVDEWMAGYTGQDRELLERLMEAQRAQGDDGPLLTTELQK